MVLKPKKEAREFTKNPKIAAKDITVYKVINRDGTPPYFPSFKYEKGFHYYQTGNKPFTFEIIKESFSKNYEVNINEGLHCFKTRERANNIVYGGRRLVKMIIPKGAKYFEKDDVYVSDQLVWI